MLAFMVSSICISLANYFDFTMFTVAPTIIRSLDWSLLVLCIAVKYLRMSDIRPKTDLIIILFANSHLDHFFFTGCASDDLDKHGTAGSNTLECLGDMKIREAFRQLNRR